MSKETGKNRLYRESAGVANDRRANQMAQMEQFIRTAREAADRERERYYRPDLSSARACEESNAFYREQLVRMLGWPLADYRAESHPPVAQLEFVGKDELSCIFRVEIEVGEQLSLYGILFLPSGEGPHPLVVVQHGGKGTPELCAGFYEESNYNDMPRRCLRNGLAVFAPQLHLWTEEQGPDNNRRAIDQQLKQLGGSIAALEIYKLRRSIDYLQSRPDIDGDRIGMCGLSYGGFYTLFTAAVDTRIKAAYISCFFNNRFLYDWSDWIWQNSGRLFMDAEVGGLICPRPLYIEAGSRDELFESESAVAEQVKVKRMYERLRMADQFRFEVFDGKHEFDKKDDGVRFLRNALLGVQ